MTANAPLKIGSRGTIGSLVRKEIEYFKRVESDHRAITGEPQANVANVASSRSRRGFGSLHFLGEGRREGLVTDFYRVVDQL